jgi:hypothetical protein
MLVRLRAHRAPLFDSTARDLLTRLHSDPDEIQVPAIGDSFKMKDGSMEDGLHPGAYIQEPGAPLDWEPLQGASPAILDKVATPYFYTIGSRHFWDAMIPHLHEITNKAENHPGYDYAIFPYGAAFMPPSAFQNLTEASGPGDITPEIVAKNFRVIFDSQLSSHELIEAISKTENFLNNIISVSADLEEEYRDGDREMSARISKFRSISLRISS